MTEAPVRAATPPVSDVDPFSDEHLLNPEPLHQALREAGPVVYLSHYDVHALARYEQVHAALVDWQHFESGSGVGLANFRHEEPWRPPSLLLEADPPRHDAPRHVLRNILAPPALRRLQAAWSAVAEELVDEVLAHGPEFNAFTALAEAFPLRAFPDAVGIGPEGRENLLPYGNMAFNAFGPRNDLVAADADRAGDLSAWVNAQCAREALTEDGFGADIWAAADRGDLTYEQAPLVVRSSSRPVSTPPCTPFRPVSMRSRHTRRSGNGCESGRSWRGSPSRRRCAGSRRCRRSSVRRRPM